MHTWKIAEWAEWYEKVGRKPIAHLTKEQRAKIVRGCRGKAVYDSHEEAMKVVESLPPIEGKGAGSYKCPLCHGIHIGNSISRKDVKRMSTTALTLEPQVLSLQTDVKAQLEAFFQSLPELTSAVNMSTALVEQSKAIKVTDNDTYVQATEQVQALNSVVEEIEDLYKPFADALYKAHRTVTGLRSGNLAGATAEVKRLKFEREQYAAEQERQRREAALKAQQEAQEREEARLIEEARQAAARGDSVTAEAILEEAVTVEAAPVVLPSTVPQVQGQSFRSQWEWTLVDVNKLKPEFLTPKEKEIGALVRSMHAAAETLVGAGAIKVTERKIVIDR